MAADQVAAAAAAAITCLCPDGGQQQASGR